VLAAAASAAQTLPQSQISHKFKDSCLLCNLCPQLLFFLFDFESLAVVYLPRSFAIAWCSAEKTMTHPFSEIQLLF
jgi:hypothetical protein